MKNYEYEIDIHTREFDLNHLQESNLRNIYNMFTSLEKEKGIKERYFGSYEKSLSEKEVHGRTILDLFQSNFNDLVDNQDDFWLGDIEIRSMLSTLFIDFSEYELVRFDFKEIIEFCEIERYGNKVSIIPRRTGLKRVSDL